METLILVFFIVPGFIAIRLLLGHHITQRMKDAKAHNAGIGFFRAGKYESAINYFTDVIKLDSRSAVAYQYLGMSYFMMEDYYRALSNLEKAIKEDHNIAEAYLYKAKSLLEIGERKEAYIAYDKAAWYLKNNAEAFRMKAILGAELGYTSTYEQDLKRACQLGDEDANFLLLTSNSVYK